MGFLDKAKAAANDLAAKADTALASSGLAGPKAPGGGDADRYFRDLGVLAFLEVTGRPSDPAERLRVTTQLHELDARGAIHSFALHTAPPPAPGMGGVVGQSAFPAPADAAAPPWQVPGTAGNPPPPPPPPPSWMAKGEGGTS